MNSYFVIYLIFFLLLHFNQADEALPEDEELLSNLLCFKSFVTEDLVDGLPFQLNYTITNIGEGPATQVEFHDPLSAEHFDLVQGNYSTVWSEIKSKETVHYQITVIPRISGILTPSPAKISYLRHPMDSEDEVQLSLSTTEPPVAIISAFEHDLMTNPRYLEWLAVACIWVASVLIPYWVYHYLTANYPMGMKKLQ